MPSGTHDGPSSQVAIWAAGLLAVGAAARITRWACHFPFWYDEAAVALNLVDRGWPGLTAPMLHAQVMPFGFLAGEVLLYETLGPDELSLRLLPLLAALGSLVCFWKLTRVVAERIGFRDELSVLAPLALFAGSYYLIRYAGELKPYSLDVFFASLFLWLGAASIAAGSKKSARTLAAAAILVGPATWLSYPVVFIAAAVSLALLPTVARAPRARLAFVAYNAALLAGFASHYLGFGLAQDAAAGESFMLEFWADSFPPADPVSLGAWLVSQNTGMLFAYPNGGRNGGSTATLLFFLLGAWTLAGGRGTRRDPARLGILALLLAPLALNLVAASLRLYPYGGEMRIGLFHAPSICLLAGIGLAAGVERIWDDRWQRRILYAFLGACIAVAVGSMVLGLRNPSKRLSDHVVRRQVREIIEAVPDDMPILLLNDLEDFDAFRIHGRSPNYSWYFHRFAGSRVVAVKGLDDARLPPGSEVLGVLHPPAATRPEPFEAWLAGVDHALSPRDVTQHCAGEACVRVVRLFVATLPAPAL